MYDEAFSLYMEEGNTHSAYKMLENKLIKNPSEHQDNIVKLFETRFPSIDSTSSDPLSSVELLFSLIKDQEQKKTLAKKMIEYLIAAPRGYDMRSVQRFLDMVDIV